MSLCRIMSFIWGLKLCVKLQLLSVFTDDKNGKGWNPESVSHASDLSSHGSFIVDLSNRRDAWLQNQVPTVKHPASQGTHTDLNENYPVKHVYPSQKVSSRV